MGEFLNMRDREKAIAIIDNDCIQNSDAIILLEGDGFYRCRKKSSLFNQGLANIIVFSGNITDYEYGSYPLSDVLPHILADGVPYEAILHENISLNTSIVASHEHQYRAYLTFLRQVIDMNNQVILYNSPARNLGWFKDSGWGMRFDRLEKEFDRIDKYSQLGHLATYTEVIEYQKWKEKQQ